MRRSIFFVVCCVCSTALMGCGGNIQQGLDSLKEGDKEFVQRQEQARFDVRTGLLDLSGQELSVLPNICDLIADSDKNKVRRLDVSDNKITTVDSDLSCFPNLRQIDLSNNSISQFLDLGNLVNLESLNLNGNNLDNLIGFPVFENLQELELAYNNLKNTSGIEFLENLLELDISGNSNLISLPGIEALNKLQELKADYEKLEDDLSRLEGVIDGLKLYTE